ncbi:MAG TPA: LysR substrate-binding domain-containing protein [Pseudolysinimonas sp.]|nr:LysR substrate-binding domain-containing protein [Pseudolysinimonas sp.]
MAEPLDIVQLRTFVAIDDCGGFGRAATALHLSQPTVSQHVRALEKRLGEPLVEKAGRGTRFTRAGDRLLVEARRILGVHDDALDRLDIGSGGTLLIGSTETAAEQLLPELLQTLSAAYPDRRTRFHLDRSTALMEAVQRGRVDLAILLAVGPDQQGTQIGTLPLRWYSAPNWTTFGVTETVPLVAYVEPCGMRSLALRELAAVGRMADVVAESTSLEGVLAAARAGLGVAVLPSAGPAPDGLVARSDLPPLGRIAVRLLSRKGLDPGLEKIAAHALEPFILRDRYLRSVPPAPPSITASDDIRSGIALGQSARSSLA